MIISKLHLIVVIVWLITFIVGTFIWESKKIPKWLYNGMLGWYLIITLILTYVMIFCKGV